MTVFLVAAASDNAQLGTAIQQQFPGENFKLAPGQWLLSVTGQTAQELTTRLGADKGAFGKVLVVNVANYWGYHDNDLWEWFKTRWGK